MVSPNIRFLLGHPLYGTACIIRGKERITRSTNWRFHGVRFLHLDSSFNATNVIHQAHKDGVSKPKHCRSLSTNNSDFAQDRLVWMGISLTPSTLISQVIGRRRKTSRIIVVNITHMPTTTFYSVTKSDDLLGGKTYLKKREWGGQTFLPAIDFCRTETGTERALVYFVYTYILTPTHLIEYGFRFRLAAGITALPHIRCWLLTQVTAVHTAVWALAS